MGVDLDPNGCLWTRRAGVEAESVGNDQRVLWHRYPDRLRQLHPLQILWPGAERAMGMVTPGVVARRQALFVLPGKPFRRQPVRARHIGKGSVILADVLQEQPGLR